MATKTVTPITSEELSALLYRFCCARSVIQVCHEGRRDEPGPLKFWPGKQVRQVNVSYRTARLCSHRPAKASPCRPKPVSACDDARPSLFADGLAGLWML